MYDADIFTDTYGGDNNDNFIIATPGNEII
jgi:hypothetical protein